MIHLLICFFINHDFSLVLIANLLCNHQYQAFGHIFLFLKKWSFIYLFCYSLAISLLIHHDSLQLYIVSPWLQDITYLEACIENHTKSNLYMDQVDFEPAPQWRATRLEADEHPSAVKSAIG
jgi:predicted Zn-dependent protease